MKNEANSALRIQILEKDKAKQIQRMNDRIYAEDVMARVNSLENVEQRRANEKQQKSRDYYDSLSQQIKTDKQRKKYDILMSEHERRVNDRNIKAYEMMDAGGMESGFQQLGSNYQ